MSLLILLSTLISPLKRLSSTVSTVCSNLSKSKRVLKDSPADSKTLLLRFLLDTLMGYQGPQSGFTDFLERAGVVSGQEVERLELTTLYQDLENLRNLKRIYEQETENQLPVLPRG